MFAPVGTNVDAVAAPVPVPHGSNRTVFLPLDVVGSVAGAAVTFNELGAMYHVFALVVVVVGVT